MLLSGIFPAITTPFYPGGNVYYKKLEHNVERYSKTPAAGIVVLGSTGEAVMLSDEERRNVLKTAREAAAPHKVLIAGTGMESALETLRLTEYTAEVGYDVVLVRTPHYYKNQMNPANLLAFYRTVADQSQIPVMIYNIPQFTGLEMAADLVIELAGHPNIIGIKESKGDIEKVRRMVAETRHVKRTATVTETFDAVTPRMLIAEDHRQMGGDLVTIGNASHAEPSVAKPSSSSVAIVAGLKTRQREVGFQVLVGAAHQLAASLEAGAVGGVLAFASAAPTTCYEIYAAWKEGDRELARLKQERISAAAQRVSSELGIAATKYACDWNGYYGGPARLPLLPLSGELKAEVERLMVNLRN